MPISFEIDNEIYNLIYNILMFVLYNSSQGIDSKIIELDIAKSKLIETLGMVSFAYIKDRDKNNYGTENASYSLKSFFQLSTTYLYGIVDRALKQMVRNKNIVHERMFCVVPYKDYDAIDNADSYKYHFTKIQAEELRSLGCANEFQAIERGVYPEYHDKVEERAKEELNIRWGYYVEKIVFFKDIMQYDLKKFRQNKDFLKAEKDMVFTLNKCMVQKLKQANKSHSQLMETKIIKDKRPQLLNKISEDNREKYGLPIPDEEYNNFSKNWREQVEQEIKFYNKSLDTLVDRYVQLNDHSYFEREKHNYCNVYAIPEFQFEK